MKKEKTFNLKVEDLISLLSKGTDLTRLYFYEDNWRNGVNNPYAFSQHYIHSILLDDYGHIQIAVSETPRV